MASEVEKLHRRYFGQLTLYQIMIMIQIALAIASWRQFKKNKREAKTKSGVVRISTKIRRFYTLVLVLGTMVFLLVEWYGIADFLYDFAAWPSYCHSAAIILNVSLMTYLLALYGFYLYRLYATFKGTRFELTNKFIYTVSAITIIIYVGLVIAVFFIEKGAVKYTPFAWNTKAKDYKPIIICDGEFSIGLHPSLRWSFQAIIIIANSYYGYIFYHKLYRLIGWFDEIGNKENNDKRTDNDLRRIYQLLKKQTTLVMVSTVSTTIFWTIANVLDYFGSFLQVLIYLDISINCCCLWLMFRWNQKYFQRFCKPCLWINLKLCFRMTKSDRLKRISQQLQLQNINSSSVQTTNHDNVLTINISSKASTKTKNKESTPSQPSQPSDCPPIYENPSADMDDLDIAIQKA